MKQWRIAGDVEAGSRHTSKARVSRLGWVGEIGEVSERSFAALRPAAQKGDFVEGFETWRGAVTKRSWVKVLECLSCSSRSVGG